MNLIEIRKEKEKLLKQKEYLTKVNGSSALKMDEYQEPNIKKNQGFWTGQEDIYGMLES